MLVPELVARSARRYASRVAVEGPTGAGDRGGAQRVTGAGDRGGAQRVTGAGDRGGAQLPGVMTFAELGDRVARLAGGLLLLGLSPGDRILDLQPNQTSFLLTELACAHAGLVRVALNHRLAARDWARIADDSGASALIYDGRYVQECEDLRAGLGEHRLVVVGDGPGRRLERLSTDTAPAPILAAAPDDLVSLNYTSGTTGAPKGVRRTHRIRNASLVNMVAGVLGGPPGPQDTYLHAGPITHTSGLFTLPFLAYGARQVILAQFDAGEVAEVVAHRGATHTAMVPTMVARLLALSDVELSGMRRLRMLGYAGAPMPAEQIRAAYHRLTPDLVQYYGLVEAIPPVTVLDRDDHRAGVTGDPALLECAGRPPRQVELAVVDEQGTHLPAGEVGEVVTRGEHVMPGYWREDAGEDTVKAVRDGWLHTGDLGRLDEQGRLWLVDRKGDMIITGGYNVYPREVEDVIAAVPGVAQVAVVGVADPDWGQRVVALYTVRGGAGVTDEQIAEACRARLSSYKKPKQIRRVEAFPLNATGKIAKNVLRAELEHG